MKKYASGLANTSKVHFEDRDDDFTQAVDAAMREPVKT
jgi:hypothetical protein